MIMLSMIMMIIMMLALLFALFHVWLGCQGSLWYFHARKSSGRQVLPQLDVAEGHRLQFPVVGDAHQLLPVGVNGQLRVPGSALNTRR